MGIGCGVFLNDPRSVAKMYKSVLNKYSRHFDLVYFAIFAKPGGNPLQAKNVKEFKEVFEQKDFSMKTILGGPFFDPDSAGMNEEKLNDFESLYKMGLFRYKATREADALHEAIERETHVAEMYNALKREYFSSPAASGGSAAAAAASGVAAA